MKNIRLLPTDNATKLYKNLLTDKLFILENSFMDVSECNREYLNIYITNSEEIKVGDYRYSVSRNTIELVTEFRLKVNGEYWKLNNHIYKKIIITNDKDLIKDGVQAIDNDFLEWFVKNPSCDSVGVERFHGINTSIAEVNAISGDSSLNWEGKSDLRDYKIIIPKEEEILLQSSIDGEAIWGEKQ